MFRVIFLGTNQVNNGSHVNEEKPYPSIVGIFKAKTFTQLTQCFFLYLLSVNVPGPTSFEFLRTVNGQVFNTYEDACPGCNY